MQGQSVCEAEGKQQSQNGWRRVTIAGRKIPWWSTSPARIRVACGVGDGGHWAIRRVEHKREAKVGELKGG